MTPQSLATLGVRFMGVVLLVQALMQVPSVLNLLALPAMPTFPASSTSSESVARATASLQATLSRARIPVYLSLGQYAVAGLIFLVLGRTIGHMLCWGLDREAE